MENNNPLNSNQIQASFLLDEYKKALEEKTHECVDLKAYIKYLEEYVKQLQEQLDEATTVVEHSPVVE
jgi:phosphohistidine phosphatase SixA